MIPEGVPFDVVHNVDQPYRPDKSEVESLSSLGPEEVVHMEYVLVLVLVVDFHVVVELDSRNRPPAQNLTKSS